jgi:hypothetical protein
MIRLRYACAATLVSAGLISVTLSGQQAPAPQAPTLTPILAGKKFVSPVRGEAQVDYTKPSTKREKDMVVTSITVKNTMTAPIARLTIDEIWYDAGGGVVTGNKGVVNGLLQPGETQTVRIETPFNPKMKANNWNFTHANGVIKPHRVDKMDGSDAKEAKPAAKSAAKKK